MPIRCRTAGAPGRWRNNWTANFPGNTGFTHYDHFDIRGDYNATSRDLIFARFSWRLMPLSRSPAFLSAPPRPGPARAKLGARLESHHLAVGI